MRTVVIGLIALAGVGCAATERQIPAGSVVVADTTGGKGPDVYSVCDDKANLIYLTKDTKGPVYAIKDGCKPTPPDIPVVAAPAPQTPPPTVLQLPQPFMVQIVGPQAPASVGLEVVPPRDPLVLHFQAVPVPAPEPSPMLSRSAPKGTPRPALKPIIVLDPNTASVEDLERLPGVTAKQAQAIVRGRPYRVRHELVDKRVMTEAELQALAPYLDIR